MMSRFKVGSFTLIALCPNASYKTSPGPAVMTLISD